MSDMSNYLKNKILNNNLQNVFVALYNNGNEVDESSYERKPISFIDAEDGQTTNESDILFPIAEENWGDITEVAIYDSETDGNELFKTAPEIVKEISESSQYKIPEYYLVIKLV